MLKNLLSKIHILAIVSVLFSVDAFGQDPEFTQFYANPLYLNPAFAGTAHCPRVSLNYRNQWPGISGSFVTYSASYDQHVDALSGGVGLLVLSDKAGEGTLSTTNVSGMYSYQLPVTRRFSIKAGLQATWAQKKVDWSKLTAGILGFSEKYFFGAAVHHLTEPNESVIKGESPLPMKITVHGGAVIPLESKGDLASLSPNVLIQMQEKFTQINFGMYYSKGPIIGGLWYRNSDAFITLIGFQTGLMKFGYSYDITISDLTNKTAGSHEFSLGLQFDCKPKKRKFRTISCPSF